MPSRWLVEFTKLDPTSVELAHVHAAISRWFDATEGEHVFDLKPYSLSPLRPYGSGCAVEVGALTDDAAQRLRRAAAPGVRVRFGGQTVAVTRAPTPMAHATWEDLAVQTTQRAWVLRFETPASFRQGGRTSPWPAPSSVLRGLALRWERFGGLDHPPLTPRAVAAVWVSDLDGASEVVPIGRGERRVHFSGFVGRIRYECDDDDAAALVGPLLALAPYAGTGSATSKGLGVTRLEPTWQPAERPAARG